MNTTKTDITVSQDEYESYVAQATLKNQRIDWNKLAFLLQSSGGWTPQGAEVLVTLTRQYGLFVLKNACALAVATNIEDGQLGL